MGSTGDNMLGGGDFDVCLSDILTRKILTMSGVGGGIEQDVNTGFLDCNFDYPGKDGGTRSYVPEGIVAILESIYFCFPLILR